MVDSSFQMRPVWSDVQLELDRIDDEEHAEFALATEKGPVHSWQPELTLVGVDAFAPCTFDGIGDSPEAIERRRAHPDHDVGQHLRHHRARRLGDHRTRPLTTRVLPEIREQTVAPSATSAPIFRPGGGWGTSQDRGVQRWSGMDSVIDERPGRAAVSLPPFEAVVDEYGTMVMRVCRAVLGSDDAAEDAWSETFISALRAYPDLRPDSDVRAWLVTIAHRKAIDQIRARNRAPLPSGDRLDVPAADEAITDQAAIDDRPAHGLEPVADETTSCGGLPVPGRSLVRRDRPTPRLLRGGRPS